MECDCSSEAERHHPVERTLALHIQSAEMSGVDERRNQETQIAHKKWPCPARSFLYHILQELSYAVEPGVATRTRRGGALKTMFACCQRMQFALYAHGP